MNESEYYTKAQEYLLSFDAVSKDMLEAHINEWKRRKPRTINDLFRAFLDHAQNRQGMPNSIGDIQHLSAILFGFDHVKVNQEYDGWEQMDAEVKQQKSLGNLLQSNCIHS